MRKIAKCFDEECKELPKEEPKPPKKKEKARVNETPWHAKAKIARMQQDKGEIDKSCINERKRGQKMNTGSGQPGCNAGGNSQFQANAENSMKQAE